MSGPVEITLDLATGVTKTYLGSNIRHAYDVVPEIKKAMVGLIGYPYSDLHSIMLQGTKIECIHFLNLMIEKYKDSKAECEKIKEAVYAADTGDIVRIYRVLKTYDGPELEFSDLLSRFIAVTLHEERFSFGHLVSARDDFIYTAKQEIRDYKFANGVIAVSFMNGFTSCVPFSDLGVPYSITRSITPDGVLLEAVRERADRYTSIVEKFNNWIATDPRLTKL